MYGEPLQLRGKTWLASTNHEALKMYYLAGQHQEYVRQLEVRVGRTLEVKNSC